ncbi:hypothetical protein HDEF_0507 [Candidatus Hamiltonella defensa 5AT (Acyrthosiphon pisum)]|uniref:Uncharacterized protein n=1 Tax=Hamiltonella defensa subsp. Acyrthosiphon pisum (strain 5AT) TaxID=572265 RepID=C4K3W8_HAMD5|nr:hypothetical protein HDEF_0507 [Candidatus Hamiltonella defensa 5AT (Acyrthosiphon pisum)]
MIFQRLNKSSEKALCLGQLSTTEKSVSLSVS